ncbi:unnamed protein product [Kuraishia capsulata CBS 1993]|uniref:tRNA (adenine(58)-N(1))-methyltransferase catalytic subunit TRM61 n=1 Tax=Kuraishia capsulata CBS 1993 TaxID=1382522 RepID=W6MRC7_9ASCO|nr:uncharacterized protein KUCA_T00003781001 [Kuraishia capsulata CBS 1993]CDK27802.1 unnamed protein product [Kuraishia capsulata CBS 1993]
MSFLGYKSIIEEGDLVLAFIGRDSIKPINVKAGEILNTRYGAFPHDIMIGSKYGAQVSGSKGFGFIHLLYPTPELWSISLPHRTQIVYTPDSSYIVQRLGITAGSRVIEAGTGSGSFSHALARTVNETGKLFTYEFHESRYLEAKKEFEDHHLPNFIITHRDVCENGFDIIQNDETVDVSADSVFLDLPSPWTAIPRLKSVVAKGKRIGICCFSPCIEQVLKTVEALEAEGWTGIEMVEVAGRKWEARKDMVRTLDDALDRLRDVKRRQLEGIEKVKLIRAQRDNTPVESADVEVSSGSKREATEEADSEEPISKKARGFNPWGRGIRVREGDEAYQWFNVTRGEGEVKSHTSYLTFAHYLNFDDE